MTRAVEDDYRDNVGRDPRNLPDDHPDRWQWEFRGTPEERERLRDWLTGNDTPADEIDDPPSQEESLF